MIATIAIIGSSEMKPPPPCEELGASPINSDKKEDIEGEEDAYARYMKSFENDWLWSRRDMKNEDEKVIVKNQGKINKIQNIKNGNPS